MLAARDRVRAALAREAGAEEAQVALTRSTGDGINIVVAGLRLEPGDEVVTTDVEHFSLIGPLSAREVEIKVARTPRHRFGRRIRADPRGVAAAES